jgi:hypothetical protein
LDAAARVLHDVCVGACVDLAVRGAARVDIIRGSAPGPGVRSASVATAEQRSWQDVHDIARA